MTFLVERLAELRRNLDHLYEIRPRVDSPQRLEDDLTLHNDVLFSLLTVSQLVIDIAGEISSRMNLPFDDYTTAVRNLARIRGFDHEVVENLAHLPGFRNVVSPEGVRGPPHRLQHHPPVYLFRYTCTFFGTPGKESTAGLPS